MKCQLKKSSTYSSMYKKDIKIEVSMFDKIDQIMNPSDLNKNKKNLIIFDNCVNIKNQNVMESYYTIGKHNNCNCLCLSQSWFELPKRSIRNTLNSLFMRFFLCDFKIMRCKKKSFYLILVRNCRSSNLYLNFIT